jgi:hypothetical protein
MYMYRAACHSVLREVSDPDDGLPSAGCLQRRIGVETPPAIEFFREARPTPFWRAATKNDKMPSTSKCNPRPHNDLGPMNSVAKNRIATEG